MPFDKFLCVVTQQPVSVADCIAHATSEGGQLAELGCPFTPAILRGIAAALGDEVMRWSDDDALPSAAQDGRSIVRVTQLLACAKRVQWQQANPYAVDPRDAYALFRGQIGHAIVERYHGDEIFLSEERLSVTHLGITLTGKPDAVLHPEHRHLDDYKTTRRIPREPHAHHIAQVNLYAWLIAQTKHIAIKTAAIVYLDMGGVARLDVSIWTRKKTEAFLRERIGLWQTGTPTPQSWECKTCPLATVCDARIPQTPNKR